MQKTYHYEFSLMCTPMKPSVYQLIKYYYQPRKPPFPFSPSSQEQSVFVFLRIPFCFLQPSIILAFSRISYKYNYTVYTLRQDLI